MKAVHAFIEQCHPELPIAIDILKRRASLNHATLTEHESDHGEVTTENSFENCAYVWKLFPSCR